MLPINRNKKMRDKIQTTYPKTQKIVHISTYTVFCLAHFGFLFFSHHFVCESKCLWCKLRCANCSCCKKEWFQYFIKLFPLFGSVFNLSSSSSFDVELLNVCVYWGLWLRLIYYFFLSHLTKMPLIKLNALSLVYVLPTEDLTIITNLESLICSTSTSYEHILFLLIVPWQCVHKLNSPKNHTHKAHNFLYQSSATKKHSQKYLKRYKVEY